MLQYYASYSFHVSVKIYYFEKYKIFTGFISNKSSVIT